MPTKSQEPLCEDNVQPQILTSQSGNHTPLTGAEQTTQYTKINPSKALNHSLHGAQNIKEKLETCRSNDLEVNFNIDDLLAIIPQIRSLTDNITEELQTLCSVVEKTKPVDFGVSTKRMPTAF